MSAKSEAAKNIVMLSRMLSGLVEIAPDLERVGSLEDAEAGLKRSIAKLRSDAGEWKTKIAQYQETLAADMKAGQEKLDNIKSVSDKTKAEADQHASDQHSAVQSKIDEAKHKADKIIAEAQAKASSIVSYATADAKKIKDDTAAKTTELNAIKSQIAAHEGALQALKDKIAPALK